MYQRCILQCKKKGCRNLSISNPKQFQWCNEESSENGNYRNDNKGLCTIAWGCIVGHYHKDVMFFVTGFFCEGAGQRDNNY